MSIDCKKNYKILNSIHLFCRIFSDIWVASHDRHGISNHRKLDCLSLYDDVIKWKHFPCYWTFVRGIHWSPVNFPHKGQWRGALMFSLICTWINDWVNNREAADLRRHRAHYDVIVMGIQLVWLTAKESSKLTKGQWFTKSFHVRDLGRLHFTDSGHMSTVSANRTSQNNVYGKGSKILLGKNEILF